MVPWKCGVVIARQLFRAPESLIGSEAQCPACGVVTVVELAAHHDPGRHGHAHAHTRGEAHSGLDRVYEPFPKMVLYGFGVLLVLLVLTPFWLSDFGERLKPSPVVISDDEMELPPPVPTPPPQEEPPAPVEVEPRESLLDHYEDISLNSTREAVEGRFSLRLKNTRGMRPEIYEISEQPHWAKASLHFYGNELKEFTVVHAPRNTTPLVIVRELEKVFGEPSDWSDERGDDRMVGTEVPGAIHNPEAVNPDKNEPWKSFPLRQRLTWYDRDYRVSATLYYTSKEPVACSTVLAVHVSDDAWLANRRPRLTAEGESESPILLQPLEQPPEDPKRLFP